jgi:hypothetical protein
VDDKDLLGRSEGCVVLCCIVLNDGWKVERADEERECQVIRDKEGAAAVLKTRLRWVHDK